jgi:hypothetical protein
MVVTIDRIACGAVPLWELMIIALSFCFRAHHFLSAKINLNYAAMRK